MSSLCDSKFDTTHVSILSPFSQHYSEYIFSSMFNDYFKMTDVINDTCICEVNQRLNHCKSLVNFENKTQKVHVTGTTQCLSYTIYVHNLHIHCRSTFKTWIRSTMELVHTCRQWKSTHLSILNSDKNKSWVNYHLWCNSYVFN